jgi:hypothetical protein
MSNLLQKFFPKGMILTRKYLLGIGIQAYTLDNYLRSGKIKLLAKGIYTWSDAPAKAEGFLSSLPRLLSQQIWVGGETALEWQGLAHNVSFLEELHVCLYSESHIPHNIKLIAEQMEGLKVNWRSGSRLWDYSLLKIAPTSMSRNGFTVKVSTPEMAALELLHQLPESISFELADHFLQSLTQVSPKKMGELLIACKSVKAKRLFFWFARRYKYPWNKYLSSADFDLGSGKRMIAKQGVLDNEFLITVPKDMQWEDTNG